MNYFSESFNIIKLMSIIIPLLALSIFIFVITFMISPKLRGKFMSRQIKATKHMLNNSVDDLSEMISTTTDMAINTKKNILDKHEDTLKDLNTRSANIKKDGIETTVRAIKNGLTKDDNIYCKHCGQKIDADSKFCKHCGKLQ